MLEQPENDMGDEVWLSASPESGKAGRRIFQAELQEMNERRFEKTLENNTHPKAATLKKKLLLTFERAHTQALQNKTDTQRSFLNEVGQLFKQVTGQDVYKGPTFENKPDEELFRPLWQIYNKTGSSKDVEGLMQDIKAYLHSTFAIAEHRFPQDQQAFDEDYMEAVETKATTDPALDGQVAEFVSTCFEYKPEMVNYYVDKYVPETKQQESDSASLVQQYRELDRKDLAQQEMARLDNIRKRYIQGMPLSKAAALVAPAKVVVYKVGTGQ